MTAREYRLKLKDEISYLQLRNRELTSYLLASDDDKYRENIRTTLIANDRIIFANRGKLKKRARL